MDIDHFAHDDRRWAEYLQWLRLFGVVDDLIEVLAFPGQRREIREMPAHLVVADIGSGDEPRWEHARDLCWEDRRLVIGWTWPDRTFADADAYEEITLGDGTGAELTKVRTALLSRVVGFELITKVAHVADITGLNYEDVYRHLLRSFDSADDLESLLAGARPVDIASLLRASGALGLTFLHGWFVKEPATVRSNILRSLEVERIVDACRGLSLDQLRMLVTQMPRSAGAAVNAEVNPTEFEKDRKKVRDALTPKYRHLFDVLDADGRDDPEYLFQRLDEELKAREDGSDRRTRPGLPEFATTDKLWWTNGPQTKHHTQIRAWLAAGYTVGAVDIDRGTVQFQAMPGRRTWWEVREDLRAGTYTPPAVDLQQLDPVVNIAARTTWQTRAGLIAATAIEHDFHYLAGRVRLSTRDASIKAV